MRDPKNRRGSIPYIIGMFAPILLAAMFSGCVPHTIEVEPPVDFNEPGTQHEITATVRDEQGRPVPHSRVDWILPRSELGVGDIVETGDGPPKYPRTKKPMPMQRREPIFMGNLRSRSPHPREARRR